jgi:hypothetical protein
MRDRDREPELGSADIHGGDRPDDEHVTNATGTCEPGRRDSPGQPSERADVLRFAKDAHRCTASAVDAVITTTQEVVFGKRSSTLKPS